MSDNHQTTTEPLEPLLYQIRLKGHLDAQWADWFAGLTVSLEANGDTLLTGPVADQAGLPRPQVGGRWPPVHQGWARRRPACPRTRSSFSHSRGQRCFNRREVRTSQGNER